MHIHSLIGILAAAASHVVAEPIPSLPPHSLSSTSASHFRSKSLGISAFLPPIEDKPELLARSEPEPAPYWLEEIEHQGISAFHPNPNSYQVFRNVKDFGAKGDGVTDDTDAINAAISSGGRCAPGSCKSSSTTPAVVYFPAGTYLISSSIIDYYYTQIIGNPNSLPILKATATFKGFGLIDGDPYGTNGLQYGATDVFYRQIRNLIFDITGIPAETVAYGVHWPTSQATSIQNCIFKMSDAAGTQHQGLFVESGSGGIMTDLTFYGGSKGAFFGNQQFTVRNLKFYNAVTAIEQAWDWGWTYIGLAVANCTVGLNMATGGPSGQTVGSVTILDSSFTDTDVAILTAHTSSSSPATGGSLILDNVSLTNIRDAVRGPSGTILAGGSKTVAGWGQGHEYGPGGPKVLSGPITPFARPSTLTVNGNYMTFSKPQYNDLPVSSFVSVRTEGAKGDGITDDTAALSVIIFRAARDGKVVFFDAGTYKVTSTLRIPHGSRIVGESYSVIMGSGPYFSDMENPHPVVAIGFAGFHGLVEWSDMIVSTQGATAGAILIQWNMKSLRGRSPSGMWDVHTRIGGFKGSELQLANCPSTPSETSVVNKACIAAFASMYFANGASSAYLENTWFWVADHDMDDPNLGRITVYGGRGLNIASSDGSFWLVGTAAEHHTLYQYQFAETQDVFAGQIQTETAYYQPNPPATVPFPAVPVYKDYDFQTGCAGKAGNCAMAWGLRVVDSRSIVVYGAGLYSFFDNYSTLCSSTGHRAICQERILSIERSNNIGLYNLNTIGATAMVTQDDSDIARYDQNVNAFQDTIAKFKSN